MHDVLRAALEPVLRDLRRTQTEEPVVYDSSWANDLPDQPAAMVGGPTGARGVSVLLADDEATRVASAADQVQEYVIESLLTAPTNWPPCPHHPETHPLEAHVVDDVAAWVCPRGGGVVAPVGGLSSPGT
ncbi:hypothetical protein GCM10023340_04930 [Nocardioides marinquilinus]|uniref:Uncharacterized protein n=1 Tax=Nocardioides marinquilinus TaxID=1210400 RepID=A0ABP9P7U0_9ACTN